MGSLPRRVKTFLASEDGPTGVEYAVMLALIIVVCVSVIAPLGTNASQVCNTICTIWSGS
jgi:pilus assembly protein Flp/PilA